MYRARQTVAEQNRPHYADPITCPVLAVGAQAYLGDQVSKQLAHVARDVRGAVIPASGHNIALENPAALARSRLRAFTSHSATTSRPITPRSTRSPSAPSPVLRSPRPRRPRRGAAARPGRCFRPPTGVLTPASTASATSAWARR